MKMMRMGIKMMEKHLKLQLKENMLKLQQNKQSNSNLLKNRINYLGKKRVLDQYAVAKKEDQVNKKNFLDKAKLKGLLEVLIIPATMEWWMISSVRG